MKLDFEGREMKVQEDFLTTEDGGKIAIALYARKDTEEPGQAFYEVEIDGVNWLTCDTPHHGIVLYTLLRDHVKEYMKYFTKGATE